MEVTKKQIDDLNAVITVNVKKEDIQENVDKVLADYRKKANMPGFRQGKVPQGMIKKIYGNAVVADELNKTIGKALSDFLKESEEGIIGNPLPGEDQKEFDYDNQEDFTFNFDVGLKPKIEIDFEKINDIYKYSIIIDDEVKEKETEAMLNRFGDFKETEKSEEKSNLRVDLYQIDENDEIIEDGIKKENVAIDISLVKDKDIKESLIGIEKAKTLDIDLKKAFENETEISAILAIKKEEVKDLNPLFRLTVNEVTKFFPAKMNEDFFNKAFGEGKVKTEEEFNEKIEENLREQFDNEVVHYLHYEINQYLMDNIEVELPEEFLKRWLLSKQEDEKISEEELEKNFPEYLKSIKWELIKEKIVKENNIEVKDEDIKREAKKHVVRQFSQYGFMHGLDDASLDKFAESMLEQDKNKEMIINNVIEQKTFDVLVDKINPKTKDITLEDYKKLIEEIKK